MKSIVNTTSAALLFDFSVVAIYYFLFSIKTW